MLGQRVLRKEDDRLITGRGLYVEDVQLPGMAYLGFVRSPHGHAYVRQINADAARDVPGVIAVITGDEWPELAAKLPELAGSVTNVTPYIDQIKIPPHHLFPDKARYVGEQIAVVVAETPYAAADGVDAVDVEYEPLPAAANWEDAIRPNAPRIHDGFENVVAHLKHKLGDMDQALRDADFVIERRFETQSHKSMAMECRAVAAQWDAATGTLNVWTTGQFHYALRNTIARTLDIRLESVRVIARDVGGGFGPKGPTYAEDVIAAIIAYRMKRPVRWAETRMEHLASSNHSGNQANDVRIAAKNDGTILGMEVKLYKDVGAYDHFDMMLQVNTVNHLTTHYRIPNLRIEGWAVSTNTPPNTPFRGAGRIEAVFTMDRSLDAVARKLGMDPVAVRRKNIVTRAEMPYKNGQTYRDGVPITYDGMDFPLLLDKALERADYAGWRERQKQMRAEGRAIGIGVSSYVEGGGLGPCEGSTIKIDATGRISVLIGVNSQGQGHETSFAQVCAHTLGARIEDVQVFGGDTSLMNFGFGTGASRVGVNTGNAVHRAAIVVRGKIASLAAKVLQCSEADIEINDSIVSEKDARQNFITLADLAMRSERDRHMAELGGPGLNATEFFYPRTVTWSSGVNVAVVEVDRETGLIKVLKYVFIHDCGLPMNPMIVDGQISGGFAQGFAAAVAEQLVHDKQGQVLTGSLMDYYVPRAGDIPEVEMDHVVFPTKDNPLGIKSVGESGPNSPPAAMAAAIEDALEGALEVTRLPVTASVILGAMRSR
jgi:aerobic carbon-monoxide dehydrogenase large subunit